VDPQGEKYVELSPYAAFAANPVYYTDPGGETLKIHSSIAEGTGAYNRLTALMNNLQMHNPVAYESLQASKVNVVLTESELPGRKLGNTRIQYKSSSKVVVRPIPDQSGYAVDGIILRGLEDFGEARGSAEDPTSSIEFTNNQILVTMDPEKIYDFAAAHDRAGGMPEGISFGKEYFKTGAHEVFGHTLFAVENKIQDFIYYTISSFMQPTSEGPGHAVGDRGGELSNRAEEAAKNDYKSLSERPGFKKIEY
jgi:hypothetical protein